MWILLIASAVSATARFPYGLGHKSRNVFKRVTPLLIRDCYVIENISVYKSHN
jgi:hypothetical protein